MNQIGPFKDYFKSSIVGSHIVVITNIYTIYRKRKKQKKTKRKQKPVLIIYKEYCMALDKTV